MCTPQIKLSKQRTTNRKARTKTFAWTVTRRGQWSNGFTQEGFIRIRINEPGANIFIGTQRKSVDLRTTQYWNYLVLFFYDKDLLRFREHGLVLGSGFWCR